MLISWAQQKSGPVMATLNLHYRPRLPGSVVGESSIGEGPKCGKITDGVVRK
jgi:hypothetical protein